jgi:Fe2+ transport system protein FeoA
MQAGRWALTRPRHLGWNQAMDASPPRSLAALEPGRAARVVAVGVADAERLAAEGLHAGDRIEVEVRLPLGGPVVVRVGRARIAIARSVAAGVLVAMERAA